MERRDQRRFFYASPESLRRARFPLGEEEERHLIRSLRLREGAEVRVVDGETVITDGPFAETKEQIESSAPSWRGMEST